MLIIVLKMLKEFDIIKKGYKWNYLKQFSQ